MMYILIKVKNNNVYVYNNCIIYITQIANIMSSWCVIRSSYWWDYIVLKTFTPNDWMENFRISRQTFQYLCRKLQQVISHEDTMLRKAISVEKRIAITLWCLATCSEYRTIAHLFGLARSTVCVIVHDTCKAIVLVLQKLFITFPNGEQLKRVVEGFESSCGMIQCIGSIDGCHIPIMPPALITTTERGGIQLFYRL